MPRRLRRKWPSVSGLIVLVGGAVLADSPASLVMASNRPGAELGTEDSAPGTGDLPLPDVPRWYPSVEVKGVVGYKDNVTLSHTGGPASGFWQSSLEALLFSLPTRGWAFNFYLAADDVRYFDAPEVGSEQILGALAQATKDLGRDWTAGLTCQYLYQNEVFDYSATYTEEASIGQIRGHALSPRGSVRRSWGRTWAEVEFGGTRQILDSPLDSYWLMGPRLGLGRALRQGSEVTLGYQAGRLTYDSRPQADQAGKALPDTSLALQIHTLELAWTQEWDRAGLWQTSTRLGYEVNLDNGSGFFDYQVGRLTQQVRWSPANWQVAAQARVSVYDYPQQSVSASDPSRRQRTLLELGLRVLRKLSPHWRLEAGWHYDRSLSDLEFDDYQAHVVQGGVGYEF